MAIIKCKMCGGELELIPGSTVAECEYCGSRQTVPNADNEKKLSNGQRQLDADEVAAIRRMMEGN